MNINGYKKNNCCNYNNKKCNNNSFISNKLNCLFEVEHFLCNFNNVCKCINLYKIFKC